MGILEDIGVVELDEGVAASHPVRALPLFVAPATRDEFSNTLNTMRMSLDPVACWRMNDARFEFDSSFVNAGARKEMRQLAKMIKSSPEAPLSIFGHADPVGKETYNLVLAQRRARSIHSILTRDVDEWKDLYDKPFGGDDWKLLKVESIMLTAIGYSPAIEDVKQFQRDFGLADDGVIGKASRPVLVKRYMDWMCPVTLKKEAFLGGGKDAKGKGDYQSCGEFNPVFLLNDRETNDPKDQKHLNRDAKNSVNRRVVIYFYEPGTVVEAPAWPCPAAPRSEGEAASAKTECAKRFWKDSQDRIKALGEPLPDGADPAVDDDQTSAREKTTGNREFKERQRTMACRFYHRMAGWSPCEGGKEVRYWVIRLVTPEGAPPPSQGRPLANEPFVATVDGDGAKRTVGSTNDNGILRIRMHEKATMLVLKVGEVEIKLDAGHLASLAEPPPDDADLGAKQRLFNLGYGTGTWTEWKDADFVPALLQFQKNEKVPKEEWGKIKPVLSETVKALIKAHDTMPDAAPAASTP